MNDTETIGLLKDMQHRLSSKIKSKEDVAIEIAISALEKQIPKKAETTIPYRSQKCSCCDNTLEPFWDYCPHCGQAFENVI